MPRDRGDGIGARVDFWRSAWDALRKSEHHMSDTTIKDRIKNDLKPRAVELLKAHEAQTEKLRTLLFSLKAAVDKSDVRLIKLYLKALTAELAELANHLSRTAKLLHDLDDLETDENVIEDLKEVEDLTAKLSDLERKLKKNYEIGKKSEDEANKALEKHTEDEGDVAEQWAILEAWIKAAAKRHKDTLKEMEKATESAKKAAASRDDKTLKQAQKDSTELRNIKPTVQELKESLTKFNAKFHINTLSKDLQEQFARDLAALKDLMTEVGKIETELVKADDAIQGMSLEPIDYKKAATLLKIPSQYEAKLKKALESDEAARVKALDALAKEAHLDPSGKEMVAILKKAHVI